MSRLMGHKYSSDSGGEKTNEKDDKKDKTSEKSESSSHHRSIRSLGHAIHHRHHHHRPHIRRHLHRHSSSTAPTNAFQLNDADLKYLSQQTELNKDAIKAIFKRFSEDNPTGYLDKSEFVKLYCSLRGEPPEKLTRIAEFAFNAFDFDKNGHIDFKEFIISFALTSRGSLRDKLEYTWRLYDLDENGVLDKDEIARVLDAMLVLLNISKTGGGPLGESSEAIVEQCLRVLDTNKDGYVSKELPKIGLKKVHSQIEGEGANGRKFSMRRFSTRSLSRLQSMRKSGEPGAVNNTPGKVLLRSISRMGKKGGVKENIKHEQVNGIDEETKINESERLREQQIIALVQQTSLSYQEVKEILDKFTTENGQCELDKAQFIKLYAALRNEPLEKLTNIANFAFNAFDSDKSGTIDLHEFIYAFSLTSQGNIREKLEFTFDLYDTDKSGFLDEGELKQVIEAMLLLTDANVNKQASDALVEQCLRAIDENGDGTVSKDEFIKELLDNYWLRSMMCPFN